MSPSELVDLLEGLDPLSELPRTGWVLRGVASPESLAAHSFGVAVAAMAIVDALREEGATVDGERVLRMALLHDAAEAKTGDIPMPRKTPAMQEALDAMEAAVIEDLLPEPYRALWTEAEAKDSLEARIVKAADKVQMMAKLRVYERQHRGRLDEFWANPKNERAMGFPFVERVFREIRTRAGR